MVYVGCEVLNIIRLACVYDLIKTTRTTNTGLVYVDRVVLI